MYIVDTYMPSILNRIQRLCTPAYVYLVVSTIILIVMGYQNIGNSNQYCAGDYVCAVSSTSLVFLIKGLFVVFWTWVLNLICNAGAPIISWILVLFPIVLMFFLILLFLLSGNRFVPITNHGAVILTKIKN